MSMPWGPPALQWQKYGRDCSGSACYLTRMATLSMNPSGLPCGSFSKIGDYSSMVL